MSDAGFGVEVGRNARSSGTRPPGWSPPSWHDVVTTHSPRVYRLAYRLTGNQHDAEDLTQEVFVRVFRSLASYTPGNFEGWLHRITTNLFLDQARRKQRIRFTPLPDDASDKLGGNEPAADEAFELGRLDDEVQAALADLPPDFRAAVVLCDIEGLSYEEIAATLDVKIGTVRSRIHRGRAALRESLAHRRPTPASAPTPTPTPAPVAAPVSVPVPTSGPRVEPAGEPSDEARDHLVLGGRA